MGSSFGFSRCFTIILGGLGLYKPSAPGLNVECPNPLNGPRFGWDGENNWRVGFHCYFSSLSAHQVPMIHPIDLPGSYQQRVVTPSS